MEQEHHLQRLSEVINPPTITPFLASDPDHVAILNTLLDLPVIGVDSEIRTEYQNGNVVRFPVLALCLEGLDQLLDKHEAAKQMLQEKINSEGGQPGVYGKIIQNLPVARTGFLSVKSARDELDSLKRHLEATNNEELAKLGSRLEAQYAGKVEQSHTQLLGRELDLLKERLEAEYNKKLDALRAEHVQELAEARLKADTEAAAELSKYKKDAYIEAKEAATKAMISEFERENKIRAIEAAKELCRLKGEAKERILRLRAETLATYKRAHEAQQQQHNKNYRQRMNDNARNFKLFQDKCYISVKLQDNTFARMTFRTASKLISDDPKMFDEYKALCIQSLKKYKRELKDQYQTHLIDIEMECRQWLKANAGEGLRAEVLDGIQQTLMKAKSWDSPTIFTDAWRNKIENPSTQITQDVLEQEAREIMADFKAMQQKDVTDGGLRLPSVVFQNNMFEAAIQEADTEMNVRMQTIPDNMITESNFLGIPLKEVQVKMEVNDPRMFSHDVIQSEIQVGRPQVSRTGVEQTESQVEIYSPQMLRNSNNQLRLPVNHYELSGNRDVQSELHPLFPHDFDSKWQKYEKSFHGKTYTEIYEALGKRKRDKGDVADENMPPSKKSDQHESTKD